MTFPLQPGSHIFTTPSNLQLSYTVCGNGPLLIIQTPGWGIGPAYLTAGLAPLQFYFTLLYFNPRGTPPSSRPLSTEMGSNHMSTDLESLRLHLSVQKLTILAHSNGGSIALHYASSHPTNVSKLLLVSHRLIGYNTTPELQTFLESRKGDPVYDTAVSRLKNMTATTDEDFRDELFEVLPWYFHDYKENYFDFLATLSTGPTPQAVWARNMQKPCDENPEAELVDKLGSVTAEVFIIVGREDAVCTVGNAERTRELLLDGERGNKAELFVIEECGHFPWVEKREVFFEKALGFLRG
ncbi:MAG: hypothetical protein M1834_007794 [Cirrosporium novae-zelandiae]|nr:MAG: hypothetical protein M1834_007794 [Cirrosporium novae-zelandiae]